MPQHYGLEEINSVKKARSAWETFFGRFFSAEIPPGVDVTFDPKLRAFKPRADKKAKYTKPFSSTHSKTDHSDDFDDFLNGETITIPEHISLNTKGLKRVKNAILAGNFDNAALKDEAHIFYALWLFKQNRITRQQMTSLLARTHCAEPYTIEKTFKILEKGQFTKEAKKQLIPFLRTNTFSQFTDWHLQRFRRLIQAAPKSEQIFYVSPSNPQIVSYNNRALLGTQLKGLNAWPTIKYLHNPDVTYDLHLSFGAIEAQQIALIGIQGAAANRAKIGKIGIDDIREGVQACYRPTSIRSPNEDPQATLRVHDYEAKMLSATMHDVYHARLHNTIPPEFHMLLDHLIPIISKHTKQKTSKLLWKLIDREFPGLKKKNKLWPTKKEALFISMMHYSDPYYYSKDIPVSFFTDYYQSLSEEGIALVWNMVKDEDIWKKLYKIRINKLGHPYHAHIKKMKSFEKVNTYSTHPEIMNLKYRFFCTTPSQENYKMIAWLLDLMSDKLVAAQGENPPLLRFKKNKEKGKDKNTIYLTWNNSTISEENVNTLLPHLTHYYLFDKLAPVDTPGILNQLKKIEPEFKSRYLKNSLSQASLENALNCLPSLSDRVLFLEACYTKIKASKGYQRKNPGIDWLLSPIKKNPLTTSQRIHVTLLTDKMQELISQYQNGLNDKEKEAFQARMKSFSLWPKNPGVPLLVKTLQTPRVEEKPPLTHHALEEAPTVNQSPSLQH
jgi:hypothetical protein